MDFYTPFQPYTLEKLNDIEKKIGVILPSDYKNFLLTYGGGQPMNTIYEQKDGADRLIRKIPIDTFLGNYDKEPSLELFRKYAVLSDRIPSSLLPIGEDGIGNYLCLGIKGENYGKIFMWWFEGEAGIDETPTYKNIDQVADSFSHVVMNLIPEE